MGCRIAGPEERGTSRLDNGGEDPAPDGSCQDQVKLASTTCRAQTSGSSELD